MRLERIIAGASFVGLVAAAVFASSSCKPEPIVRTVEVPVTRTVPVEVTRIVEVTREVPATVLVPYESTVETITTKFLPYVLVGVRPTVYNEGAAILLGYDTDGNGIPDYFEFRYALPEPDFVAIGPLIEAYSDSDEDGIPDEVR